MVVLFMVVIMVMIVITFMVIKAFGDVRLSSDDALFATEKPANGSFIVKEPLARGPREIRASLRSNRPSSFESKNILNPLPFRL